ncbi:MAG: hypothetical protein ABI556_16030 [Gemmatimonadales bacterium]
MRSVVAEYDVKKDDRNRIALKSAQFDYYHAEVFDDGHIELHPKVLADASLSLRTLSMMDSAMINVAKGRTGKRLDPREILDIAGDEEE